MVVGGGIGEVDLERQVVERASRQGRLCAASCSSGVYSTALPSSSSAEPGELGAADDLEEDRLVLAGRDRVTGALHGVAEVLGRQRGAVAVLETLPQVEGDLGGVLVVLPDSAAAGTVSWFVSSRVSPS